MQLFLTGASGFVGGAFAQAFGARHAIRAMSRSPQSDARIAALGATPVRCALGAVGVESLQGCEVLVHCAAHVAQWGRRDDFMRTTVEGTRQLLQAAQAAGIRRFLHISSEAVLFHGQPMRQVDERYPYPQRHAFLYAESKAAAEQSVLAANQPGVFDTLVLRPRMVWGPGDQTILPVLLAMLRSDRFFWLDGGRARTSTTHIANLVHAMGLALERGEPGQVYFISDGQISTFRDFLGALVASQGEELPTRSLPGWLARALGRACEGLWRALGRESEPPLTAFASALMSRECTLEIGKARRELGYEPVLSVAQGLAQMPRI